MISSKCAALNFKDPFYPSLNGSGPFVKNEKPDADGKDLTQPVSMKRLGSIEYRRRKKKVLMG